MLDAFATYFAKEWSVISRAPLIFLMAAAVVCGLAYIATSWLYKGRISHLDERIRLRDDQLDDYKTKLEGASPDEARARLDALEAQVAGLLPRHLSETQKAKLRAVVTPPFGSTGSWKIEILYDVASRDSQVYAAEFIEVFRAIGGWVVQSASIMGPSPYPTSGIGVKVKNRAELTAVERLVVDALTGAALQFDYLPPGRLHAGDVALLFTTKTTST